MMVMEPRLVCVALMLLLQSTSAVFDDLQTSASPLMEMGDNNTRTVTILANLTNQTSTTTTTTTTTPAPTPPETAPQDSLLERNAQARKGKVFLWTKHPETYVSHARRLTGHAYYTLSGKRSNTQCAMECIKSTRCKSYNFMAETTSCELNDKDHKAFEKDLLEDVTSEYHIRDAYSIDENALGPCHGAPCSGHGRCLETRDVNGRAQPLCMCDEGWAGIKCNMSNPGPQWADWADWSPCSVTCARGWRSRERSCEDTTTGRRLSASQCWGADMEYGNCELVRCPSWETWGTWGDCSADITCGTGGTSRTRKCSNGGKVGVDRYCLGLDNQTAPCEGVACDGPIRLTGGAAPGEGHVELYDDIKGAWRHVCGDMGTAHIADVVCRQAGWPGGEVVASSKFGQGHGDYGLSHVSCKGAESRLLQCEHNSLRADVTCLSGNPLSVQCNVDGVWALWSPWSECSVTCENGSRTRERTCDHPSPRGAGRKCKGDAKQTKICSLDMCPMDGQWQNWQSWGACSTTCGGGEKTRTRVCKQPKHGGMSCDGNGDETQPCSSTACPVNGVWQPWADWSDCSVTCSFGNQWRTRECKGPFHGGDDCTGAKNETQTCMPTKCPVNGHWMDWASWQGCSASCGGGLHTRVRECYHGTHGGSNCTGAATDQGECNDHPCPVDGVYNDWSSWLQCSLTCGGGISVRNRTCIGPFFDGKDCQGEPEEEMTCNEQSCPVDGEWDAWREWSTCSVSCGSGDQTRDRSCHGTAHGGVYCDGPHNETRLCNTHICPVDGVFDQWASWGECSLTCGTGSQSRDRTCIGPYWDGLPCNGDFTQAQDCNTLPCPVDGYYEEWADWGTCSKSCGGGRQYRDRQCVEPLHGGQGCQGDAEQQQKCQTQPCPIDGYYNDWAAWGECSVSCGGGDQWRKRECVPPQYGGQPCSGPDDDDQECNTHNCPIDGVYEEWGMWSGCNATCGGGLQERTRVCVEPQYGGQDCQGPHNDFLSCSENPCPIPGDWFPWSPWSPCTVTCGAGTKQRERVCNMESYGDLTAPCEGDSSELVDCHTFDCLPLARTCTEWGERGLEEDTEADVDVDGPGHLTLEPVQVFCDMTSKPGVGITVIGHDQEERHQVQGWEGAREYEVELEYNITFEHAQTIVDQSGYCEQYISWECKAALIHNFNDNMKVTTGWLNRTGGVADYFGGATPGSQSCACGMNSTCVDDPKTELLCNCDRNDETWRQDDGLLTFKDDLPVYAFVAGDTGKDEEIGYFTVGPLKCSGKEGDDDGDDVGGAYIGTL